MSMRVALASLVAADLFLLWRLFQGDLGAPGPAGRDIVVLAMASCTFLAITIAFALLPHSPRRAAILVVRNGVIQRGDSRLATLANERSQAVVVQEGHVAVLEKLGRYSRTLGPGTGRLNPGETLHKVLLTGPRSLVGTLDCSTCDSVSITADFELEARIMPARGDASSRRPSSPTASQTTVGRAPTRGFAWSPEAVVRAAYAAPNWELAILNAARHALREQLASASLEEIFDLEERHREAFPFSVIADHIRIELNDRCRAWGAEVLRFQLNRVKIPAPTEQSILANWKTRNQPPSSPYLPANQQAGDETPSSDRPIGNRGAILRLVPVLSRGPATSLREAVRQRLGYLTADGVEINGERYLIRTAVGSASGELSLRAEATYFALAVLGDNLARKGIAEGDYVLFESQSYAANGSLVATLIGGELGIKVLTRKPGHSLLESDAIGQPSIVLTDSDAPHDDVIAEYATCLPPVEYWPADDARVLGSAAMIFQPLAPRQRPGQMGQALDEGKPVPQASQILESAAVLISGDPADSEVPGEPPLSPIGSGPGQ